MEELITKYVAGQLSASEEQELKSILSKYGYELEDVLGDQDKLYFPNTDTSDKIKQNILDRFTTTESRPPRAIWQWLFTAAAITITTLALSIVLIKSRQGSVGHDEWLVKENTGSGVMQLTLSDSSKIWLNAHSSIAYQRDFNDKDRKVRVSGQAFFDVHHDKTRPFYVYADSLHIEVVGTSFMVNNYPEDAKQTVSVVTGKVKSKIMGQSDAPRNLLPGDVYGYYTHNGKRISHTSQKTDNFQSWREGTAVFEDEDLHTVLNFLARRYQLSIDVSDSSIMDRKINLKIRNEPIGTVLKVIKATTDVNLKIEENKITIR